jgi:hypothetical protein
MVDFSSDRKIDMPKYACSSEVLDAIVGNNFEYKCPVNWGGGWKSIKLIEKSKEMKIPWGGGWKSVKLIEKAKGFETKATGEIKNFTSDVIVDTSYPYELIIHELKQFCAFQGFYRCAMNDDVDGMLEHHRVFGETIVSDTRSLNPEMSRVVYNDKPRAVGLWLWDRVKELKNKRGAVKQALKEFHETGYLEKLGLEDVEESDLRFWCRRTDECIKANEVLPFTKRKKGTKES